MGLHRLHHIFMYISGWVEILYHWTYRKSEPHKLRLYRWDFGGLYKIHNHQT